MKMRALLFSCISILTFLCSNKVLATETTIHFTVHGDRSAGVYCYQLKDGDAFSLGFKRPDANSECSFTLNIDKPEVFFIRKAGPHNPLFKHVIYLKPGDKKNIDLYLGKLSTDYDSSFVEQPNTETIALQNWLVQFNQTFKNAGNIKEHSTFFSSYNQLEERAKQLRNQKGANNTFNDLFSLMINADLLYLKASAFFYNNERLMSFYDTSAVVEDFYKPLADKKRFCNTEVLFSVHGLDLIKYAIAYRKFCETKNKESIVKAGFADFAPLICNDTLKAFYVAKNIGQVKTYEEFVNKVAPFHQYLFSSELKRIYDSKEKELTAFAKGDQAYNFSLKDTHDKTITLTDYKGKIVVLDVWAMWCAPCLAEKPKFLELEESYANRDDIIFIGVSVDGLNKKDLWKKFVEQKEWKGIELISNYDESVMKYYKIEGIPRFMIFDKEGKIVTVDAPRPSDPEFKKLIETTLSSK